MLPRMPSIDIDLVSDVVCPWCLIGTRHLDLALQGLPDVEARARFRPFLLDPETPAEGDDLRERLRHKYGGDPDAMFRRVEGVARAAGIPLDFAKVRRSVSTVRAHTLLRYALDPGAGGEGGEGREASMPTAAGDGGVALQGRLARALFDAYFLAGEDIGQTDVLSAIAVREGLDESAVRRVLGDEDALADTRREALHAARQGISGVPFFILAGRFAVSGAQPPASLKSAIERALTPD